MTNEILMTFLHFLTGFFYSNFSWSEVGRSQTVVGTGSVCMSCYTRYGYHTRHITFQLSLYNPSPIYATNCPFVLQSQALLDSCTAAIPKPGASLWREASYFRSCGWVNVGAIHRSWRAGWFTFLRLQPSIMHTTVPSKTNSPYSAI